MARRTSNKIEPAAQTLTFQNAIAVPPGGAMNLYIDLSQCASIVNRRFYRQGINWAIAGFKLLGGSDDPVLCQISKLPNSWVLSNSWEKSMRAWLKMSNEALSEAESVRPRFLDFKIYADDDHHSAGFPANLIPSGFKRGEWDASKIYTPNGPNFPGNTNEFELVATGRNYPGLGNSGLNAVSMIEGYAASRALPPIDEPNTPADAVDADGSTPENWMSAMFNEGTDQDSEVLDDMRYDNRTSPYPFEGGPDQLNPLVPFVDTQYPNGANQGPNLQVHDIEFVTSSTIGATTRFKGGNFPCGLVKLSILNTGIESFEPTLIVDLVPGDHRGYLCEPMTEM